MFDCRGHRFIYSAVSTFSLLFATFSLLSTAFLLLFVSLLCVLLSQSAGYISRDSFFPCACSLLAANRSISITSHHIPSHPITSSLFSGAQPPEPALKWMPDIYVDHYLLMPVYIHGGASLLPLPPLSVSLSLCEMFRLFIWFSFYCIWAIDFLVGRSGQNLVLHSTENEFISVELLGCIAERAFASFCGCCFDYCWCSCRLD